MFGTGSAASQIYLVEDASPLWGSGLSSSTVNALDLFGPTSTGLAGWGRLMGSCQGLGPSGFVGWTQVSLPQSPGAVAAAASMEEVWARTMKIFDSCKK